MYIYQRQNIKTGKIDNKRYATDSPNYPNKPWKVGKVTYRAVNFRKMKPKEIGVIYK